MDGHKTESQLTAMCLEKSGSRVRRPQCPSVCHQFTKPEERIEGVEEGKGAGRNFSEIEKATSEELKT